MKPETNKIGINKEEIPSKNINLKIKIFDYFYNAINKNHESIFTLSFLHILETIQIISYAISEPHLKTWKNSFKNIQIISVIISSFRLVPLVNYFAFSLYIILLIIFIILIFIFFLGIIMQILFRKDNSKLYRGLLLITKKLIAPITIFLFIPIIELLLIIFTCKNDKISLNYKNDIKCWRGYHLLASILSCFGILLLFSTLLFLNSFYFYPFQSEQTTLKINSKNEIILLIIKFIYSFRLLFIKDEYISIGILLFFSILLIYKELKNPSYNNNILIIIINIRNSLFLWTFFMLFIAKIFEETKFNNLLILVFLSYPIIIFSSIKLSKINESDFEYKYSSLNDINSCLSKVELFIKLVYYFSNKNNNLKNVKSDKKNDIILKGIISIHLEKCLDEECPLLKFIKNEGNFNAQKLCLLNFVILYFNKALKIFPNNKLLRFYFIHFNLSNKLNINNVGTNLDNIKKMRNNNKEQFIIYCLENEIIKMKNIDLNQNDGNESEDDSLIIEQNYKRLKDLIYEGTKLYVEFWGIFSNNITNKLNTSKLYKLGEKLNEYLKEINYIWENLNNKKIDVENEYIVLLYSKFLRDILLDKTKSEEVMKKLNDEYHLQVNKTDKSKQKIENIENLIENEDYTIIVNSNEKGKCKIFQFSNSLTYLIGYKRQEIINKPLEVLMPSIFIDGHSKKVEEFIKHNSIGKNFDKESFHRLEEKSSFILIKSKIGYLIPFNANFSICDNNDFSNNFIIKANLELRDSKSLYPYYILTKPDFSVENISSSAINLGLTIDLLKKYVIKLNILIRSSNNKNLNLSKEYSNYIEIQRKITWVYPHIIYPKNNSLKIKNQQIEDLIQISNKKIFNLQIIEMKYKEGEIIGFVFKFNEIQKKEKFKNSISLQELVPPILKNEIIFDLLSLNYRRVLIVKKKSGFKNLREEEEDIEIKDNLSSNSYDKKENRRVIHEESSEEEKVEMILTKEKIFELQAKDSNAIKSFINILQFYGGEINLIRHRPNKEQYFAGAIHEPLIKVSVNNFIKRIGTNFKKNLTKSMQNENNKKEEKNEDIEMKQNIISPIIKENAIINNQNDDVNYNFTDDSSNNLSNIFNENSIINLKLIDFIIYIILMLISISEFCITYKLLNNNKKEFLYLDNSYKLLNKISYTKYFVLESVLTNSVPNYLISSKIGENEYINFLKSELIYYREIFIEQYTLFTNGQINFSKNLNDYLKGNIPLRTLNNGKFVDEQHPFNIAMNKLTTGIFYISSVSEFKSINMTERYTYELMFNLLNGYYIVFFNIYSILLKDINQSYKFPQIIGEILIFFTILIFTLCTIIFYEIMLKFLFDTEKPINLFFTIKKKLFEDLKNSAENFSNILLKKYIGNEDNEEESQLEYKINIKTNDINISKFTAFKKNKISINKKGSFIWKLGLLITFFILFELYIILKYFKTKSYFLEINKFTQIYNVTQNSNTYIIFRTCIIKQYFFNESLSNYRMGLPVKFQLMTYFKDIANPLSKIIFFTTKTDSFLKDEYKNILGHYLYSDFSDLTKNEKNILNYEDKIKEGIKLIETQLFEHLRYFCLNYFIDSRRNKDNNISDLLYNEKWYDIHEMIINFIRPWSTNIIESMNSCLFSLIDNIQAIYISIFTLIIVLITLAYCIFWKSFEEKNQNLLKNSFELINLIPKEIKCIIASKING